MAKLSMGEGFERERFRAVLVCRHLDVSGAGAFVSVESLFEAEGGISGSLLASLALGAGSSKRRPFGLFFCVALGSGVAALVSERDGAWDPAVFAEEMSSDLSDVTRSVSRGPDEVEMERVFKGLDFSKRGEEIPVDGCLALVEETFLALSTKDAAGPSREERRGP